MNIQKNLLPVNRLINDFYDILIIDDDGQNLLDIARSISNPIHESDSDNDLIVGSDNEPLLTIPPVKDVFAKYRNKRRNSYGTFFKIICHFLY